MLVLHRIAHPISLSWKNVTEVKLIELGIRDKRNKEEMIELY